MATNHHFRRHFVPIVLLLVFSSLTASITIIGYEEIIANPTSLPDAADLVLLGGTAEERGMPWPGGWNSGAFSNLSVFQTANLDIGEDSRQETVLACLADPSFFRVLSVSPEHGRLFNEEDALIGAPPVAIISDSFWRTHFGSREDLSDTEIFAAGRWIRVVGVLPAKIDFPARAAIYLPRTDHRFVLDTSDAQHWSPDDISRGEDRVLGRLRPGVTLAQARGMENALLERIRKANTDPHHGIGSVVTIRRLRDSMTLGVKGQLTIIAVGGCFVALVAFFSLFFLSAARATELRKDMAIRISLGATTPSLLRREVVWWLWAGLAASAAVITCTELALRSARKMEGLEIPRLGDLSLSFHQAVYIVAGTAAVAVLLALPYFLASRRTEPVAPILNRAESQTRLTVGPVISRIVSIGQLSLALALTAIALQVCVNYWRLASTAPGIDPSGVFVSIPISVSSLNLGNSTILPTVMGSAFANSQSSNGQPNAVGAASTTPGNQNARTNTAHPVSRRRRNASTLPSSPGLASRRDSDDLLQSALKPESEADRAATGYIMDQEIYQAFGEVSHQPGVASVAVLSAVPYQVGAGGGQSLG
ncbi:MAG TPA: ABC transporter permease [Candidatus Acidoferrum sp.]|nr:ABC transporter permease [Candidatus Acidoferrum sp.]